MIPSFKTKHSFYPGDMLTPVAAYQRIRNLSPYSLLLECSDYQARDNSFSFVCFQPLASIVLRNELLSLEYEGSTQKEVVAGSLSKLATGFREMLSMLAPSNNVSAQGQGLFGYFGYSLSGKLERTRTMLPKSEDAAIPEIAFSLYKYVLVFNHLSAEIELLEQLKDGEESNSEALFNDLFKFRFPTYPFKVEGEEESDLSDDEFLQLVKKGKSHCKRGDVFQVVFSRQFRTNYSGDEFQVYRRLRSINPSPYLFFLDAGSFRLFGSSPETQLQIRNGKATLHPIAGTYKRSGNDIEDMEAAARLFNDPKEKAEHTMLVDLARNDLSTHAQNVNVESWCETQFFSHVIHLVSKVSGSVKTEKQAGELLFSTFPAGTLTGAPKIRAMQLIDEYEPLRRSFYGGAIGQIGFDGSCNLAILIRSFMATKNTLYYQAGAGVVAASNEESELKEVQNKLAALRQAIEQAQEKNKTSRSN